MVKKTSSEFQLSLHQMDVFQIRVTAKLAGPSQMRFYDLQLVRQRWRVCVNLCQTFLSFTSLVFCSWRFLLYCCCCCSLQGSCEDAGCCCGSDCTEHFLRPGLPGRSSVQTKPDTERQKHSERWDRSEEEEPAAHLVHPHRRPGVFMKEAVRMPLFIARCWHDHAPFIYNKMLIWLKHLISIENTVYCSSNN